MKKMRIFELAKDLSLEAKELLRVAKDLAISVENTMSILDVHDIERIKKRIEKDTQKPEELDLQDVYEEQRVSTNIIRRRAKPAPAPEAPAKVRCPYPILRLRRESRRDRHQNEKADQSPGGGRR